MSLERIRELLHGEQAPIPPRPRAIGSVEVCSHLAVADGIEIVIEPGRAGLSPEQVRRFIKGVMTAFAELSESHSDLPEQAHEQEVKGNGNETE